MSTSSLLYKKACQVGDSISIMIPTIGEIFENQELYYWMISLLTATPYDMMVYLDDKGIDFTEIDDYQLFLWTFTELQNVDTSLVFGDLDVGGFVRMVNPVNNTVILRNPNTGVVIDKLVYSEICDAIRKIHHLKRNYRNPANKASKDYMIRRAREKMKRRKNTDTSSQLEELIVALVNTEQFHYNFETVKDLTIYQFNESVQQVIKKIDFDNRMHGIYAGTISAKDMSQDDLNWLTHK